MDLAKIISYIENSDQRVSSAIGLHSQQERSTGFIDEKKPVSETLGNRKNWVSEDESVNNPA